MHSLRLQLHKMKSFVFKIAVAIETADTQF